MESELPSQTNCCAYLIPLTFGILKLGKITCVLGLKQHCVPNNYLQSYQESRHDYWTENETFFRLTITTLAYL